MSALAQRGRESVAVAPRPADKRLLLLAPLIHFSEGRTVRVANGCVAQSLTEVAEWAGIQNGISARHALRMFRAWEQRGAEALDRKPYKNRGASPYFGRVPQTIPDKPEGLLDSLTEAGRYVAGLHFRDNLSARACHEVLEREHARLGLSIAPSYNAVLRFLTSFPQSLRDFVSLSAQQWNDRHRPSVRRDYSTVEVLEWWNLDHAQDDFFCYNDFIPKLGRFAFPDAEPNAALRMWLTAVQDVRSRYIVGYCFSAIPNSDSIVSAIRFAVLRCGRPPRVGLTDRGKDFLKTVSDGPRVEGSFLRLIRAFHGDEGGVVKAIGRNPQSKPVESWFKLKRERFDSRWDSRCGNKPANRPDSTQPLLDAHNRWAKEGAEGISPSLPRASTVACETVSWIEGWYHAKHRHTGDGMGRHTAEQVFRAGWPLEQQEAARARLDPQALEEFLWHRELRAVRDGGCIQLSGSSYEPADEASLAALRAWDGDKRKVEVACDPYQLDYAVAYNPETGERLGALVAQRPFAWGERQENIKTHLRTRGNHRRTVKEIVGQLAQIGTMERPALLEATGTDGLAAQLSSSPRVLRAREQRRLAQPRIQTFACDVSDADAALLDQVEIEGADS